MTAESATSTAILALLRLPGVGPVRANRLLARPRGEGAGLESLLDDAQRQAWAAALAWAEQALSRTRAAGVEAMTIRDAGYPAQLRILLGESAPPVLFVHGRTGLL